MPFMDDGRYSSAETPVIASSSGIEPISRVNVSSEQAASISAPAEREASIVLPS